MTRRTRRIQARYVMPLQHYVTPWLIACGLGVWSATTALAQGYAPNGSQFIVTEYLLGDQIAPDAALGPAGGLVVWQDNAADGDGWAIAARRLTSSGSPALGSFRVNRLTAGDQIKPRMALLQNGGAAFVWQGGSDVSPDIYAQFLRADGTFVTLDSDVLVNTYRPCQHLDPAIASLPDGNVLVVYSSFGQDGSLLGVFGQRLSPAGQKVGAEFQINQTTAYNQRSPALAALPNGNVIVLWITESGSDLIGVFDVDLMGRLIGPDGPAGAEFRLNTGTNVCATPAVAALANGGFVAAWGEYDPVATDTVRNSWDIFARTFDASGVPTADPLRVNTHTYGDQYVPRVAAGDDCLVVWTSLGQDGSNEGIYGQFLTANNTPLGGEFRVNTFTASRQIDPAPVRLPAGGYVVYWSSYTFGGASQELFAQRYARTTQPLPAPDAPFVSAISQVRLSVTWPEVAGFNVDHYELYVDGASTPVPVATNLYSLAGLGAQTIHSFQLAYVLTDGRRSGLSPTATGTTWGEDLNGDGLPDDWQAAFWGSDPSKWPPPWVDSDGDGATNLQEFLAGTDPTDPASVLKVQINGTAPGQIVSWNTCPGLIYQLQVSTNLTTWTNVGQARFAHGADDSVAVAGSPAGAYYRVIRLR